MVDGHQGQGRVTVPGDASSLLGGEPVRAGTVQFSLGVVAPSGVEKSQDRQDGGPFRIGGRRGGKGGVNLARTGRPSGQVHGVVGKKPIGAGFVNGHLVEAVGGVGGAGLGVVTDDGFQIRIPVVLFLLHLSWRGGPLGRAEVGDVHLQPLHVLQMHIHQEIQFLPHVVNLENTRNRESLLSLDLRVVLLVGRKNYSIYFSERKRVLASRNHHNS